MFQVLQMFHQKLPFLHIDLATSNVVEICDEFCPYVLLTTNNDSSIFFFQSQIFYLWCVCVIVEDSLCVFMLSLLARVLTFVVVSD